MIKSLEALLLRCTDTAQELALLELSRSALAELEAAMPDRLPFREPAVENLYNHPDPELQAAIRSYLALRCGQCFLRSPAGRADKALLYSLDFFSCTQLYLQSQLEARHLSPNPAHKEYTLELNSRREEFTHLLSGLRLLGSLYPDLTLHVVRPQPAAPRLPLEQALFQDPVAQEIFRDIFHSAGQELLGAPWLSMKAIGQVLSPEKWRILTDRQQLEAILKAGSLGICFLDAHRVNADFVSLMPCCDMLAIYMQARQMPEAQRALLIDAGADQDITFFEGLSRMLSMCDPSFQCKVFST